MSWMRAIFVTIRAMNYTDQATRQVGANIDALIKKQQELRKQASQLLVAGIMWTAFAAIAVFAITKIMEKSIEGRQALFEFNQHLNKMLETLGTAFTKILTPALKVLGRFFDMIADNPALANLLAVLIVLTIAFVALKGVLMITSGAMTLFGITTQLETLIVSLAEKGHYGLAASLSVVQACLGPVVIGFTLMFTIAQRLPAPLAILIGLILGVAAAIIILRTAVGDMSWMVGIAIAGAAAGAMAAGVWSLTQPEQQTYQTGIYSVRRTGPAIVHEGEEIRSKRNVMYSQETNRRPETRLFNITFSGDIHTKADKEELKPLILKTVREAMDNKA